MNILGLLIFFGIEVLVIITIGVFVIRGVTKAFKTITQKEEK